MSKVSKHHGNEEQPTRETIESYREKTRDELALLNMRGIQLNMPIFIESIKVVALIRILIEREIVTEEELDFAFEKEIYENVIKVRDQNRKQEISKLVIPGR